MEYRVNGNTLAAEIDKMSGNLYRKRSFTTKKHRNADDMITTMFVANTGRKFSNKLVPPSLFIEAVFFKKLFEVRSVPAPDGDEGTVLHDEIMAFYAGGVVKIHDKAPVAANKARIINYTEQFIEPHIHAQMLRRRFFFCLEANDAFFIK